MLPSRRTPIANRDREKQGIFNCENMYVLIGKDGAGKKELKTCNCRVVQKGRGRTSESGVHQRGVGSVDKAAGDRATENLNETWLET